jgi:hypothetical protein
MITEQQLTDSCTPELIKKIVELAEGFEWDGDEIADDKMIRTPNGYYYHVDEIIVDKTYFPFLIHRAVEGINKKLDVFDQIVISKDKVECSMYECIYENYQPSSLTHAECAMFHCLIEVLK